MLKKILNNNIMSGLIVGLIVGLLLYFLDKAYNKKIWCTQEIKSFNYSSYNKKELNILIDTCEDQVDKYNLLEELNPLKNPKNPSYFKYYNT